MDGVEEEMRKRALSMRKKGDLFDFRLNDIRFLYPRKLTGPLGIFVQMLSRTDEDFHFLCQQAIK